MTNTRPERRCPRTWPHQPHGPWFTGEITHAAEVVGFDCPGVPVEGER